VFEWQANVPEFNIIEHIWDYIKYRLAKEEKAPRRVDELWELVQDIWADLPKDHPRELYESLPRRMSEVIENRGRHTKY
ncbi:MAG: hypothetical protein JOS17DRAFT_685282, partial [Linnemannia elongata]